MSFALTIAALLLHLCTCAYARAPLTLVVHVARVHQEDEIEDAFVQRSTPGTSLYRRFMSMSELRELVGATPKSIKAVHDYLAHSGATNVQILRTGDAVAAEIDALFARKLGYTSGDRVSVEVPSQLAPHVRAAIIIADTAKKSPSKHHRVSGSSSSSGGSSSSSESSGSGSRQPGMTQTPSSIRARYDVPEPESLPPFPRNYTQGVAEFEGEYFYDSDVEAFAKRFGLRNVSIPVMGPTASSSQADATEGTLDLEYMAAVAGGRIPTWWLAQNTDNNDPGNIDFTLWCEQVLSLSPVPYVVSISWGSGYERYVHDVRVLVSDNDAFRKLGLLGVTVFAASGDSGPGVRSEQFNCKTFTPSWPSSSSYLTSVGATYADSTTAEEESVNWSGGGFSTVFARPAYQDAAVQTYLRTAQDLPPASFYNASGRGYPDVAALGTNFEVIVGGLWKDVSGTSAASPTFAGIVSLIVAERIAAGQSALGFLNPTLYALGRVGFDVTRGKSLDTNCDRGILPGFPAATGWDAISGLGTPDYTFLRANL